MSRSRAPPALEGVLKMRANLDLGLTQLFLPHPRPNHAWLAELGTTIEAPEPAARRECDVGLGMWAANAATVSPAPDTADRAAT